MLQQWYKNRGAQGHGSEPVQPSGPREEHLANTMQSAGAAEPELSLKPDSMETDNITSNATTCNISLGSDRSGGKHHEEYTSVNSSMTTDKGSGYDEAQSEKEESNGSFWLSCLKLCCAPP